MNTKMRNLYWVERETSPGRWQREDGWRKREDAERSAAFYRREYRRKARILEVCDAPEASA